MATNDDLDDFFKKKDRKGNKHKKQTGLLTNNEELLKQLVIVTSATSAFKENMDFDDDDDEQQHIHDESVTGIGFTDDTHKHPTHHHKTKISDERNLNGQTTTTNVEGGTSGQQQQQQPPQDEWEEFDSSNSKYEQLRLKFSSRNNNDGDDNNDDEFYDDDNNPNNNNDNSEKNADREQPKDKHVWKINEVKEQTEIVAAPINEEQQQPSQSKPVGTSTGAYRPPQLRTGGSSITVVSGVSQRSTKKKEPNLASTDEFPTLKPTINKK